MCVLINDWSNDVVSEHLKGKRTMCEITFDVPQFEWDTS